MAIQYFHSLELNSVLPNKNARLKRVGFIRDYLQNLGVKHGIISLLVVLTSTPSSTCGTSVCSSCTDSLTCDKCWLKNGMPSHSSMWSTWGAESRGEGLQWLWMLLPHAFEACLFESNVAPFRGKETGFAAIYILLPRSIVRSRRWLYRQGAGTFTWARWNYGVIWYSLSLHLRTYNRGSGDC